MTTDVIFIHELKIPTKIGVYAWEQQVKQWITFDLEIKTNIAQATKSDDIKHTIDYAAVCAAIHDYLQMHSFKLLETLAEHVTTMIIEKFSIKHVRLCVKKSHAIENVKEVGIIIEREVT